MIIPGFKSIEKDCHFNGLTVAWQSFVLGLEWLGRNLTPISPSLPSFAKHGVFSGQAQGRGRGLGKGSLLTFLLTAGLTSGIINTAKAGNIDGFIFNSHNGQSSDGTTVSINVNNGASGTQYSTIPEFGLIGYWLTGTGGFSPQPQLNDTIRISASLTVGPTTYTSHTKKLYDASNITLPTTFLEDPNKNVPCISVGAHKVKDLSGRTIQLRAKGNLRKNQSQDIPFINYYLRETSPADSMKVDTSDIYTQVYFNTQKQDSNFAVGDTFDFELYQKTAHDTTFFQQFNMLIDTMKYGGASMLDSVIYNGTNFRIFKDLQIDSVWTTEAVGGYVYPKALVKSNRTSLSDSSKYYFTITENGSPFYADSLDKKLLAGQRDTITFSECPQGGNFTHVLQCSTSTDGDATPENNTKQKTISGPMAVELSYFGAMPYDKGIRLEWITQSSLNSFLWEIYRGQNSDTLRYDLIATQPGDGNSNQPRHYYHDDKCAEGLNWYRLGEVGFSGEKTFYGPINAFAQTAGALRPGKFKAYPNPARRLLDVRVDRAGNYGIYNVLGQKLGEVRNGADGKSSSDIRGNHPAGIYYLMQEGTGQTQRVQVVR